MANAEIKTLKKFTVQVLDEQGQPDNVSCNFDDSLVPGLNDRVEALETKTDSMSDELETATNNIEKLDSSLDEKLSIDDFNKTPASKISDADIEHWITEETDPTVPLWVKNIAEADIANWNAGGVNFKSTYVVNLKHRASEDLFDTGLIIDTIDEQSGKEIFSLNETVAILDDYSEDIVALDEQNEQDTDGEEDQSSEQLQENPLISPHFYEYSRGIYNFSKLKENDILIFYANTIVLTAVVVLHEDDKRYLRDISDEFLLQDYYRDIEGIYSKTKYVDTLRENITLHVLPAILYIADHVRELEDRIAALEPDVASGDEEVVTEDTDTTAE